MSRDDIVAAARELFAEHDPVTVSTEDIRRRAEVSTGSMYHHFPQGKASLVGALFAEELQRHHDEVLAVLEQHQELATGIRAGVEHFLGWVREAPDRARLLLSLEDLATSDIDATLQELAERFARGLDGWLTTVAGGPHSVPLDVLVSIWIGPAKEYARAWLAHRTTTAPSDVTGPMSDAAAAGVLSVIHPRASS